ncbi:MAG: acylphosphatase [Candidatus Andersenbacteria bacterium]
MTTKEKQHLHIKVTGRVQSVNYRRHISVQAMGLGITGYIQNNPDGSVTIEAEGDHDSLRELVDTCSTGSPKARIERVEVEEGGIQHFDDFRVRT